METRVLRLLSGPIQYDEHWGIVCMVQYNQEFSDAEIYFRTFNEAYEFESFYKNNVGSITLEFDDEDFVVGYTIGD